MPRRPFRLFPYALFVLGAAWIYREALFFGEVQVARDASRVFIPDGALVKAQLRSFEWPLWNPYVRLGQPLLATLQAQALYPLRLLSLLFEPVRSVTVLQLLHVGVAYVGTFLAARALAAGVLASSAAAFAFAFGPTLSNLGLSPNLLGSLSFTGLVVFSALWLSRRPALPPAALLAVSLSLSFQNGSPELLLFQGAFAVALALVSRAPARAVAAVAGASAFALLLSAATLFPSLELAARSERGHVDGGGLVWSVPLRTLISFVWFHADLPKDDYWKEQGLVPVFFVGLVTALLALASLFGSARPRARARALFAVGAVFGLLSLGAYFRPSAALLSLPPFSFFRYPAKYALALAFVLPLLAAPGLSRLGALLTRTPRARKPAALLVLLVPLAFGAALLLFPLREGALLGLGWTVAFAFLFALLLFLAKPSRVAQKVRLSAAALVVVELSVSHLLDPAKGFAPRDEVPDGSPLTPMLRSDGVGRVSLPLQPPDGDERLSDRDLEKGGRRLLLPLRHVEEGLVSAEGYYPPEPANHELLLSAAPRRFFDLAGVTHFLRFEDAPPFPGLERAFALEPAGPVVFRSDTALPRARVVYRAERASAARAFAEIKDGGFDFEGAVLVGDGEEHGGAPACPKASAASVRDEGPARVVVDVDACADGYLVLADSYYPGWRATVDGEASRIVPANFVFRAVPVRKGKHTVEMRYWPSSFLAGAVTQALATLGLAAALVWRRRVGA